MIAKEPSVPWYRETLHQGLLRYKRLAGSVVPNPTRISLASLPSPEAGRRSLERPGDDED